ncbi:MAG: hypothetical protein IJ193_00205 [Bacilli bacterium]|nr:hypothetical protein [Bacilli bacterium]
MDSNLTIMLEEYKQNINQLNIYFEAKRTYEEFLNNSHDPYKNIREEKIRKYKNKILSKLRSSDLKDVITPSDRDISNIIDASTRLALDYIELQSIIEFIYNCFISEKLSSMVTNEGIKTLAVILLTVYINNRNGFVDVKRIHKDLTILANTLKNKML